MKIKVASVAESCTTVSQNIQIYFGALLLDARFDAPAKPPRMLASTGKGTVGQKIGALWDMIVIGLLLSSHRIITYGGCYHTSISMVS